MHAFSAEHFVGLELFSKVINRRHLGSNCKHKLGTKINLCSLSFGVAKAHDNIHCYTITHTHTHSEHEIIQILALKCNCSSEVSFEACCIASDEPAQIRKIMIHT